MKTNNTIFTGKNTVTSLVTTCMKNRLSLFCFRAKIANKVYGASTNKK